MGEQPGAPEDRCSFVVEPEDVERWHNVEVEADYKNFRQDTNAASCWRPVWETPEVETDRCVWHTEAEDKPIDELRAIKGIGPQCLDGASLASVEVFDCVEFEECRLNFARFCQCYLEGATFTDSDLRGATFADNYLRKATFTESDLRGAEFTDSNLLQATFTESDLRGAEFTDNSALTMATFTNSHLGGTTFADSDLTETTFTDNSNLFDATFADSCLRRATFADSDLTETTFTDNSSLIRAIFTESDLRRAEFTDSTLDWATFADSDLDKATFTDSKLFDATFTDSDLHRATFVDSDLHDATFESCDCLKAKFISGEDNESRPTNLEDVIFKETELRKATFENARLYQTIFTDVRISSQTTFDTTTVYERESNLEWNREEATQLEAAAWVHRRLENLHEENAMSEEARRFHIRKQEAERKNMHGLRRYAMTFMRLTTNHGESLKRILVSSAAVVIVSGVLYPLPFVGGIASSTEGRVYQYSVRAWDGVSSVGELVSVLAGGGQELLWGLYFSIITFTTIGYGDLYPVGAWAKILVGIESLGGAILIALFIFVLGRQVAR